METIILDDEMKKEFCTNWDLEVCKESENLQFSNENFDKQCEPKPEHLDILCKRFGHKKFRPLQWKIINSIITERRDNCAIMATGYGKSLCYQFPAVYMGKLALIISPLISLMEDQVSAMQVSHIPACLLGTANKEQRKTIDEIFENKYSLIYLTPEFCTGEYGKELLHNIYTKISVSLIAVDEAHCISSWGHDFRHQYRHIGILKKIMPDVPILAVTATATPKVIDDIIRTLRLRNPQLTRSGFDRHNLYFTVSLKSPSILCDLRKSMEYKDGRWTFSGPTIIYCITRKESDEISQLLNDFGVTCLPYHAGLSINVRKYTHEKFVKDKINVIVATIAFGMGIDKPDVRHIIHYGASSSIEAYYQEVGRAGRDGLPATCSAFYSNRDFDILRFLYKRSSSAANKDKMIDTMRDYLSTTKCRRQFILSHFLEKKVKSNNPCCDNCSKNMSHNQYEGLDDLGRYDFTEDAKIFLKAVKALNGKFGINMYVLFLRGSKMNKLTNYVKHTLHGSGKDKSENWWKGIAVLLEKEKYLKKVQNSNAAYSYAITCISEKGETFLKDEKGKLLLSPIPELIQCLQTKSNVWLSTTNETQPSTSKYFKEEYDESNLKLYHLLMNKRYELATSHDCMPYLIASNKALKEMALQKPITVEQLRKCQLEGLTETKINNFGEGFIDTIKMALNISTDHCVGSKSIFDILCQHPLSDIKSSPTAHTSYSFFNTGLTVKEIAQKRNLSPNTILSHLIDVMKLGYPIKLTELGVTKEIKCIIEDAIQRVDTGLSLLTPIKNACSPDITFNQIKSVVNYLQIRQHLKRINTSYIEFDNIDSVMDVPSKNEPITSNSAACIEDSQHITPTQNLVDLIDTFDKLENPSNETTKEENSNFSEGLDDDILAAACDELESSLIEQNERPDCDAGESEKSLKKTNSFNFSVLDSPPRQTRPQEKRKIEEKQEKSKNNKKLKLPPWLISQRIA